MIILICFGFGFLLALEIGLFRYLEIVLFRYLDKNQEEKLKELSNRIDDLQHKICVL